MADASFFKKWFLLLKDTLGGASVKGWHCSSVSAEVLWLLKSIRCFFQVLHYGAGKDLEFVDIEVQSRIPDLELPNVQCPLSAEEYLGLTNLIDPLRESDNLGVDIYLSVLNYLSDY